MDHTTRGKKGSSLHGGGEAIVVFVADGQSQVVIGTR
ncbi:hypothetical protein PSAC2689_120232 [Paraburkholderia sacchari]